MAAARVILVSDTHLSASAPQAQANWDAELKAKHAQIAATAVAAPVVAQRVTALAVARGAGRPAYAGVGGPR